MELDNEFRQQAFNRFSDGVEQDIDRSRASAVPVQPHGFSSLNHRPMGLFNEERAVEKTTQHNLGLVLSTQASHQSVSSIEEGLVVIEHPCLPGVFHRTDTPHGVECVLNHQRFSFLGDLLVGRVEGDEVDIGLNQLTQEGVNGGNRRFIKARKQHFNIAFVSQARVKHAVNIVLVWRKST